MCSGLFIVFVSKSAVDTGSVLDIYRVTSAPEGVNDTRFSLFLISLGIPTIIIVTFKGFECIKGNKMSEK